MLRTLFTSIALAAVGLSPGEKGPAQTEPQLSGPYTHENLTIFLVHGSDVLKNRKLLTLDEALEAKKLVVHETGNVNQLEIQNTSGDEVFVQAGDIVKGGRQDRVLSVDMIVPAHSKKIPIESFCVESGRWQERRGESSTHFSQSKNALASKKLKMAARDHANQSEVWENVGELQGPLGDNVGKKVSSDVSSTSLELTLENGDVEKTTAAYMKDLANVLDAKKDAVGYAFAINGTMNSAEVYGSHALFTKLWPKLLKAAIVEAISERKDGRAAAVGEADAKRFFTEQAALTKPEIRKAAGAVSAKAKTGKRITFETRDASKQDEWIHRTLY